MRCNMQRALIAALILVVIGCAKEDKDEKNKGNPITSAKGPIGQGGDPAAMAARRTAQQLKAIQDMDSIKIYYNAYRIDAGAPTAADFLKYLEAQRDAPALAKAVKEGQYVIVVPPGGNGVLAYEKEKDYNSTRVVLTPD